MDSCQICRDCYSPALERLLFFKAKSLDELHVITKQHMQVQMHHVQQCMNSCFRCNKEGGPDAEKGKFSGQQLVENYHSALDRWKYTQPTGVRAVPSPPDAPTGPPVPNPVNIPNAPNAAFHRTVEQVADRALRFQKRRGSGPHLEYIGASMLYNLYKDDGKEDQITPYMIQTIMEKITKKRIPIMYAQMVLIHLKKDAPYSIKD